MRFALVTPRSQSRQSIDVGHGSLRDGTVEFVTGRRNDATRWVPATATCLSVQLSKCVSTVLAILHHEKRWEYAWSAVDLFEI